MQAKLIVGQELVTFCRFLESQRKVGCQVVVVLSCTREGVLAVLSSPLQRNMQAIRDPKVSKFFLGDAKDKPSHLLNPLSSV